MKIFSVTALTFRMHSVSLTIGSSASRTFNGIGPAIWNYDDEHAVVIRSFYAANQIIRLTFAHITVTGYRASLAGRMADTSSGQADLNAIGEEDPGVN